MKQRLLLISIVILFLSLSTGPAAKANASLPPYQDIPDIIQRTFSSDTLARVPEAHATLFAKKTGSMYEYFILETDGTYHSYPYWRNVTNPTYAPEILFDDINRDGKKELTIVLTTGYGAELIQQEVHVLHQTTYTAGNVTRTSYDEVLVDNPLTVVLKNVSTKLSAQNAEIIIEGRKTVVNIERLQIRPENRFSDIGLGSIVKFAVVGHELIATVGTQVSPAAFVGAIQITYEYKGKMYQAKRIEFTPRLFD